MHPLDLLAEKIPEIEEKLGYSFKEKSHLILAFVHRSFFNENKSYGVQTNERLEFLGDSVLGLIISDYLYAHFPNDEEGHLSHLRSQLVEAGSCASLLLQLNVAPFILLGRGEKMNDGRGRETILADLFEAIMGAIYLDGGIEAARTFFFTHFSQKIHSVSSAPGRNWKADLQDFSQKKYQKPPLYKIIKESGPDHSKLFEVAVFVGEKEEGLGQGSSKKQAEQAAAQDAISKLLI